jgi:Phospholipase_D-nuclease N-terminal
MGSKCRIAVLLVLFSCLSLSPVAAGKVYTNTDLKHPPSLDRNSKIDPVTGKVIKDANDASHDPGHPENRRETFAGVALQAKHYAEMAANEIETNTFVFAAVIGFLFLIWSACLVDILRNEFRGNNKLIWFIAVTFIPVVGSVLYFFIGTRQKKYRIIREYE